MSTLRLPRTHRCLACGRDNPRGLGLELSVELRSGQVLVDATFTPDHVGFVEVIHGGAVATVLDEAMVWAATWAGGRFCLCGELSVRYLQPARPGTTYRVEAQVRSRRSRMTTTTCRMIDADGREVAAATGKYLPVSVAEHARVVKTFLIEDATGEAAARLAGGTGSATRENDA